MSKAVEILQQLIDEITNMTPEEFMELYESKIKNDSRGSVFPEEVSLDHLGELFCSICSCTIENILIENAKKAGLNSIVCPYCSSHLSIEELE